ncbi:MAG: STAS domain-containing protein [Hyphomicrobiaceae bacterium]|nr:STAS domain-containing protein [Hyphomicrobiaceae bacterium]MCC0023755.1 STAS domain-containing protein [Hyphomicrobiaceae bacterium]
MSRSKSAPFALPASFDLDAIDDVRDWLVPAIEAGDVALDAGAVDRVYTNSLIMLLSARADAAHHGHSLSIVNPSPAFADAARQLGLGEHFMNSVGS